MYTRTGTCFFFMSDLNLFLTLFKVRVLGLHPVVNSAQKYTKTSVCVCVVDREAALCRVVV